MNVTIRRMDVQDLPAVIQIDQMSFTLPWPPHTFQYEVSENKAARCLVAETDDNTIAGMIVSWIVADELHIATFATHPDFRRQGVGARLLAEALNDGRRLGVRRAFLEVRAGNDVAQTMYKKTGFVVTGRRPKYYRDNAEDAILMTLEDMEAP